jgi:large subunit ribosomal protein L10
MLTKAQKEKILEELTEKFKKAVLIVFVDPTGIGVNKLRELRQTLKTENSEYKMYKKKLLGLAFDKVGFAKAWLGTFKGSVAVAISYDADFNIAKLVHDFAKKEKDSVQLVGGVLEGKYIDDKEILTIAKLPPKEVLIAQVAAGIIAPVRGLVRALNANLKNLVFVLSQIKKQ